MFGHDGDCFRMCMPEFEMPFVEFVLCCTEFFVLVSVLLHFSAGVLGVVAPSIAVCRVVGCWGFGFLWELVLMWLIYSVMLLWSYVCASWLLWPLVRRLGRGGIVLDDMWR